MAKIRVGILGYGNLGKGVELSCYRSRDLELVALFTRRDPKTLHPLAKHTAVYSAADLVAHSDDIDVLVLCGGSAKDLPTQTPECAEFFNVVNSFDNHAKIPEHFACVDKAARKNNKVALISVGWDPGMFSLARLYGSCMLPEGCSYTFWGRGVSQGHSDAIRRIPGVIDARQYTVPVPEALAAVREGKTPTFTAAEQHTRECFVVAAKDADKKAIEKAIVEMPDYFADYDTSVTFISEEDLLRDHAGIPHGGSVIRSGKTGVHNEHNHVLEYSLKLDSNPEFTGGVLAACARACFRLSQEGQKGCKTIFDVPPAYFSDRAAEVLRSEFL